MAKKDKKIIKLQERIQELEEEMYLSLKQKKSSTVEISISEYHRKIQLLYLQLEKLL